MSFQATITEAAIISQQSVGPDTFLMALDCPQIARDASPGQFIKIKAWAEGPFLPRPFSVHSTKNGELWLLYRRVGRGTTLMSQALAGAKVHLSGPFGRGLPQVMPEPKPLYLVGGGIGLAPMSAVLDWLNGVDSHLFYGERGACAIVEEEWLASWAGDFTAMTEDGTAYGQKGLVTAPLAEALAKEPRDIFACGPVPMLAAVSELARQYKVTPWVSLEAEMACAFGVCLTCSLPLIGGGRFRVCQEGPVLDGAKVDWAHGGKLF